MAARFQAVMMIVTKTPTPIKGNLGKFFLEGREFASTESGNTALECSYLIASKSIVKLLHWIHSYSILICWQMFFALIICICI